MAYVEDAVLDLLTEKCRLKVSIINRMNELVNLLDLKMSGEQMDELFEDIRFLTVELVNIPI